MWKNINIDQCLSHINRQPENHLNHSAKERPAVTISRMCGSGGRTVASKLAEFLRPLGPSGGRWTVFDRELIRKVLEDHSLSARLAEYLPESNKPLLGEMKAKLPGKANATARGIVEQSVETIWHLAESGYVILVGRGANVITARRKNVFHVRLVGSLEKRISRMEEMYDFDRHAAIEYIKAQDAAKKLYLKEYFGQDIDNPELYHLIVNTDRIAYDEAARLISDSIIHRFRHESGVNSG